MTYMSVYFSLKNQRRKGFFYVLLVYDNEREYKLY